MNLAAKESIVDVSFIGAAGIEKLEYIDECSRSGIIAFKTFLQIAPKGRED